jgi:phage terminase Nu1 subunit (DNA packaging protein)
MDPKQSLLHNLDVNTKGKVIWTSSYELLQQFVEEGLNLCDGEWSSPGGDGKLFEHDDTSIRWYAKTQTITVSGKNKNEIEKKLKSLASISKKIADNTKYHEALNHPEADANPACIVADDPLEIFKNFLNNKLQDLAKEFSANMSAVNSTLLEHSNRLEQLKNQESDSEVIRLRNENLELKKENGRLTEQINNLSCTLTDLQDKVKQAEEEKASLITAIWLLNKELGVNQPLNSSESTGEKINSDEADDCQRCQQLSRAYPDIPTQNRYSTLAISGPQAIEETVEAIQRQASGQGSQAIEVEEPVETIQSQASGQGQTSTSTQDVDKSSDKPKSVLIIGDSIIKHIDPRKLSKKTVYKRSFPGKRVEEIHDEIDNIQTNDELSYVIIHAGTNNLPSESVDSCVRKIQKLALKTRRKFQNSKIGISSIIHRDDINVSAKLSAVNGKLKEMANNDDFVFIDNSRIDGTCLNGSKLHLNAKGSAYLANNFIKFIRPLGKRAKLQTGFLNPIHQLGQLLTQLTTQPMTIPLYKKPRR